ncbi:hypothetical protein BDZ97DRAFT_1922693 [Flammula alnicola]|nr:hypothetical protein BDZ97DRAFT_1922693 [Flammula alnicola]
MTGRTFEVDDSSTVGMLPHISWFSRTSLRERVSWMSAFKYSNSPTDSPVLTTTIDGCFLSRVPLSLFQPPNNSPFSLELNFALPFHLFFVEMPLSRLPLPSIALVLTSDRVFIPPRPSVIKIEVDELPARPPSVPEYLMKTIDLRDVEPSEYPQFSYILRTDSSTDVGDDDADTRTIFEEKIPVTSRGFWMEGNAVKDTASVLLTAFRKLFPVKTDKSILAKSLNPSLAGAVIQPIAFYHRASLFAISSISFLSCYFTAFTPSTLFLELMYHKLQPV